MAVHLLLRTNKSLTLILTYHYYVK